MQATVNEYLKPPLPNAANNAMLVGHPGQRLEGLPNVAGECHMVLLRVITAYQFLSYYIFQRRDAGIIRAALV